MHRPSSARSSTRARAARAAESLRDLRSRALRAARPQPRRDARRRLRAASGSSAFFPAPARQHPHPARGAALHRPRGAHRLRGQPGGRMAARQLPPDRGAAARDPGRPAAALLPRPAGPARRAAGRPAAHLRRRLGFRRAHRQRLRRRPAGPLPARLRRDPRAHARRAVGAADDAARRPDREPAPPGRTRRRQQGGTRGREPVLRPDRARARPEQLDAVLALLNRRGVGESFLAQMAQQLQDHRTADERALSSTGSNASPRTSPRSRRGCPRRRRPTTSASATRSPRCARSATPTGPTSSPRRVSLTRAMLTSPAFAAERDDTRDQTLHAIELLARKSGTQRARSGDDAARPDAQRRVGARERRRRSRAPSRTTGCAAPAEASCARAGPRRRRRAGAAAARWRRAALPAYLGAIACATALLVAWMLLRHSLAPVAGQRRRGSPRSRRS